MTDATIELTISELGHRGDGIAAGPNGPLYVPGTLAGEKVLARLSGDRVDVVDLIEASPDRTPPICRHIAACGGCLLQHMAAEPYLAWKRQLVVKALADRGITTEVAATHAVRAGSRRRAALTAVRAGHKILLGYHEKASHKLVDISECPVLEREIVAALPGLKQLAGLVMPKKGELKVGVLHTATGLDVAFENAHRDFSRKLADLGRLAAAQNLARLSVNGEVVLEIRPPSLAMGKLNVVPAPGGFTQATVEAEETLSGLVLQVTEKAKRVADLFAGCGTFALRIAPHASVHAVEGDAAALAALERAVRVPTGIKKVTTERRDLFRRPLMAEELAAFDAVVFDPPRAGAQAQAEQLARSSVKRIAAVSCNPATLARDLRILIDGGYRITSVTPVDQFLFSPHVEAVAILEK